MGGREEQSMHVGDGCAVRVGEARMREGVGAVVGVRGGMRGGVKGRGVGRRTER